MPAFKSTQGVVLICLMSAVLAGCGGGGGGSTPATTEPPVAQEMPLIPDGTSAPDAIGIYDAEFDDVANFLDGFFNTAFDAIPTSDSATYNGVLRVDLTTAINDTTLFGEASVTANFAGGTLTGGADTFVGTNALGDQAFYEGTVDITDGAFGSAIGAGNVPNDVRLEYAGDLTGNAQTISLSGALEGKFIGAQFNGGIVPIIQGIEASDAAPVASVNGDSVSGTLDLVARVPEN